VIVEGRSIGRGINLPRLARAFCDRTLGAGADGMLVLEHSARADVRMRVFNADGTEAAMCGNGARCVAWWLRSRARQGKASFTIETKAGLIGSRISASRVRVRLTDPKGLRRDLPLKLGSRVIRINSLNTGVPHAVIFVQGLEAIDVDGLGRLIRYHKAFMPQGTNVNFIEVAGNDSIAIRTYERGVEGETLACGTGSVASALVFALKNGLTLPVKVRTKSGEELTVYYTKTTSGFSDVWLEGRARIVYRGEYLFSAEA